jgi:hypothetical protein
MFDRFMDNYGHWEAGAQFNFAVIIIAISFMLTIMAGFWLAYLWNQLFHHVAIWRCGWPPAALIAPVAPTIPEDTHRVDVTAVRLTTHGQKAENDLVGQVKQHVLGHAEENGDVRDEPERRPANRRLPSGK